MIGAQYIIQESNEKIHNLFVEGLNFKQTTYGTNSPDFNNREIAVSSNKVLFGKFKSGFGKNTIMTLFKDESLFIGVLFLKRESTYELMFATTTDEPTADFLEFLSRFDMQPKEANSFSVFGKVMFVASIIASEMNIRSFHVKGTQYTSSLYNKLKTNGAFIKIIDSYGWKIIPLENGFKVSKK